MRVLFLQQQPCIRTLKYAAGLRTLVPGLQLGFAYRGRSLSSFYGVGDELFDRWWPLMDNPLSALCDVIAEFKPDLVHSHNLPDELTVRAQEVADGRIPVIHDVHDFASLRRTPYRDGFPPPEDPMTFEQRAVEDSAALVTVSDVLLAEIAARYQLPGPTLVFANYVLGASLPQECPPLDHPRHGAWRLVYQGTLFVDGGHYDLRDIFRALVRGGIELHVYPARRAPEYQALDGVCCHDTLDPHALLRALPEYEYGWAGFNATRNGAHLDTVLPNKLFEYLGCGLPVLTLHHHALEQFVREHGVGLVLEDIDDLSAQLAAIDLPALRRQVITLRGQFTVERNIHRLVELYEAISR
jgi:glycosyltransferase involved in cell wall biosynthesis